MSDHDHDHMNAHTHNDGSIGYYHPCSWICDKNKPKPNFKEKLQKYPQNTFKGIELRIQNIFIEMEGDFDKKLCRILAKYAYSIRIDAFKEAAEISKIMKYTTPENVAAGLEYCINKMENNNE